MKKCFYLFLFTLSLKAAQAQSVTGAVLSLKEEVYVFDTLDYGADCYHDFEFTNTGTGPLIITDVRTACTCDVPNWKHEPVKPGGSGKLGYKYDTHRVGPFYKTMTVTGNFAGEVKALHIKGYVRAKPVESETKSCAQQSVAVLSIEEGEYDFDTLEWGASCTHDFVFTNTGDVPLVISHVSNTCSCAMASFKKEPVEPGKKSIVSYKYDSTRPGPFKKSTTITGNFAGSPRTVYVKGYIRAKKHDSLKPKVSSVH